MAQQWTPRIAWAALAVVMIYSGIYHQYLMPVTPDGLDAAMWSRGIGTPLLLWLNGYLGVFLDLQFMGPVGVLALPLSIVGLWHWRRLVRWQQALLVFVWMAALIIGVFGGFNYRYALTMQPLLVVLVVGAAWRLLQGRQRTFYLVGLVVASITNTVLSLEHRQRTWRADQDYEIKKAREHSYFDQLDSGPRDLPGMVQRAHMGPDDKVLVNNLPIWYHLTDQQGVYYWSGSDQLFLAASKPFLFRGRTDDEVAQYLSDSLHCMFIFSNTDLLPYNVRFKGFLEERCELLEMDNRGHTLHRLKDTFGR